MVDRQTRRHYVALVFRVIRLLIVLFAMQRAHAALTLDLQLVTGVVTSPVYVTDAGDGSGRLFIVEQSGRIKILDGTTLLTPAFLDISSLLQNPPGNEEGLLGLAFDPNFATNGLFYVYHTNNNGSSNVVARYSALPVGTNVVNAASRAEVLRIAHTGASNHNGGCLQFGPDGYLYIATGDGGGGCDSTGNNAQNINSLLGKMLRIHVTNGLPYSIPGNNPFAGATPGLDEIWAYGLRNPWRFSFDRLTGDLWIGDVGQGPTNPREEVDFQAAGIPGGQNYGWNCMEGFLSNTCPGVTCATVSMIRPVLDFDHSGGKCAVTGGYRYRGAAITPLSGSYVFADYCSGQIFAATNTTGGTWGFSELTNTVFLITSFGEDAAGELYFAHRPSATGADAIYRIAWRDADGDGMPDDNEILAGTDPNDPTSFFRITATGPSNVNWTVTFPTVLNKTYRLERTDDLAGETWTNVTGNIVGTGAPVTITDTNAAILPKRYYRTRLIP